MKKLFLLCLTLVVMAAAISGLQGCTSAGYDYSSGSGKDYPTYDYQGNRLEHDEGESHQNRGY